MMWLNTSLSRKITKIRSTLGSIPVVVSHPEELKPSIKRVFCFYCDVVDDANVMKLCTSVYIRG